MQILLVDDNPAARALLTERLRMADVHCAHEYDEALRRLRELRPDVLLTDICLGLDALLSGLELAREARRFRTDLVIVTYSGMWRDDLHMIARTHPTTSSSGAVDA